MESVIIVFLVLGTIFVLFLVNLFLSSKNPIWAKWYSNTIYIIFGLLFLANGVYMWTKGLHGVYRAGTYHPSVLVITGIFIITFGALGIRSIKARANNAVDDNDTS